MTQLKKTSLAMIAAGLLTAGATGVAQAEALATSVLEMSNFVLKHSAAKGGGIYDISQFAAIIPASSASVSATYNGDGVTVTGGPTATGQINLAPVCKGPACPGVAPDTFPRLFSPVSPALGLGNFIAADQFESGSPITGQILNNVPILPPATVKSGSWANLLDPSGGPNNADANNQLTTAWIFSPELLDTITFSFDAAIYQESYLSALEQFPASVQTTSQFFFKITDQDTGQLIFDFTPDGIAANGLGVSGEVDPLSLNQGTARVGPLNGTSRLFGEGPGVALTGTFSATSPVLIPGHVYRLEATLKTTATAITAVPEPSVLALLGISLVGLAATRRRKNHAAA